MTDEEKIQKLIDDKNHSGPWQEFHVVEIAMRIAEWKDQQFAEEKKDLRSLVDMLPMNDTNQTIIEDLKALLS